MIKILIGNITSNIVGYLPDDVQDQLYKILSYRPEGVQHSNRVKNGQWDGYYRLYYQNKGQSFYSGLVAIVIEVLQNNDIEYQIVDTRIIPCKNLPHLQFSPPPNYTKRDYQQLTIDRALSKSRGILKIATGGGKSMISSEIIGQIQTFPFMFYVLTKDLLDQAYDTLSSTLNEPIGRIGGGVCDIKNINVCTIQTAVRAINSDNKTFKISDYLFDEEDKSSWNEDQLDNTEKLKYIKRLLVETKGLVIDECHHAASKTIKDVLVASPNAYWRYGCSVGPNSFIEMRGGCFKNGFVGTIEKAFEIAAKESKIYQLNEFDVIDFNGVESRGWTGNNFAWKNCQRILRHSGKQCLDIKAQGTTITVTPDHSVFYAKLEKTVRDNNCIKIYNEPKIVCNESETLSHGDVLLGDNGNEFNSTNRSENLIDMVDFCLEHMKNSRVTVHCNVKEIDRKELKKIGGTTKTIYNWRKRGGIPLESFSKLDNRPTIDYLTAEGSSARISSKINLENWAYILGFYLGDGWLSNNGSRLSFAVNIEQEQEIYEKLENLNGIKWNIKKRKMLGKSVELRANNLFVHRILLSIFGNVKCHDKFIPGEWIINWNKESKEQLLQGLLDSDGHTYIGKRNKIRYSFVTTSLYLAKGVCSLLRSIELWGSTSICKPTIGGTINGRKIIGKHNTYRLSWTKHVDGIKRSGKQERFDHTNIKFSEATVREIIQSVTPEYVYDLEMSGHPSFVSDGILVHNSATPYREDNADILLQAMFGKKIVDISASYLIDKGFLLPPYIFFERINHDVKYHSWQSIYSNCVTKNDEFNTHVAETARHLVSRNLSVLILVQQYPQGEFIKHLIPNTEFVTGKMSMNNRRESINDLREGKSKCMIATTLADEGLDIPTLDAVLLAGGGSSATRIYQRIGRTLRLNKNSATPKNKSIVVYYDHDAKYLDKHTRKARKIIKEEPRFNIIQSKGMPFINQEIDHLLNLGAEPKSIFQI